ncbi:hypothetical protein QBC46DRAFT_374826 [Diplogelasinospora grovesii]|uniref:PH domain-containing protein n=1 Tax=Diplogelasinospora grovesii TaxID=303347 RepID=A0AAN6S8D1_9PEZI|nr:hypothetical protein QBC46DRAFT_374826 [Diplogelasinospora grovesii]
MNAVVNLIGKKALGDLKKKNIKTNSDNPYLEKVPIQNRHGKVTKYKMRERPIPEGLSDNDRKILRHVRKRAYSWDMGFRLCCFRLRIGWSFIIGLIPVLGDVADALMCWNLIRTADKIDGGLPTDLRWRMMLNMFIDFGIGFIPIIGDFGDALYRSNTRNAWLLDAYLTKKAEMQREGQVITDLDHQGNLEPGPHPPQSQRKQRGGWFSRGGSRQPDVEEGVFAPAPAPAHASTPASGAPPAYSRRQERGVISPANQINSKQSRPR